MVKIHPHIRRVLAEIDVPWRLVESRRHVFVEIGQQRILVAGRGTERQDYLSRFAARRLRKVAEQYKGGING